MLKRDRIFYWACGLSGAGVILAVLGYDLSLMFFVAAYLLRPALHEFGLARQYADERQHEIHSRSGNLAFVVLITAMVGLTLWRLAERESTGDMYTLIGIGLAARSLTGLVMNGEYRKAGVLIISVAGVLLALFIVTMGGLSAASAFGVVLGSIIVGLGQVARKFPRVIAILLGMLLVGIIVLFGLHEFSRGDMEMWLLFVFPVLTASLCLYLGGSNKDELVSARVRSIAFGSLGAGATIVFALLLVIGGSEKHTRARKVNLPEGEVVEVDGVPCTGGVEYYENGNLMHCSLARDDTLSGQPLAAGTGVHFTEEGVFEWCFFRENTLVQGYLVRGQGHGFMTRFHPNGKVRTTYLAEDQVIQGIPCAKFRFLSAVFNGFHNKHGNTSFHENGQLSYCELSENFTIEGQRFRRADAVRFDRTGKLIEEE